MKLSSSSIIRPNPWALILVIAIAIFGVLFYVVKMYKLEGRLQEILEQQRLQPSASPSASESAELSE